MPGLFKIVSEDIPRLYTGIAECMAVLVFVMLLPRRYDIKKSIFIIAPWSFLHCAFLVFTARVYIIFWIPCMFLAVFSMYMMLHILIKRDRIYHIYYTLWAFLAAEFTASLEWQIESFFLPDRADSRFPIGASVQAIGFFKGDVDLITGIIRILLLVGIYTAAYNILFKLESSIIKNDTVVRLTIKDVVSSTLIVLLTFVFSNMSFFVRNSPFSARLTDDVSNIRTIIDLGGLAIMYAFQSRLSEVSKERELMTLNNVLKAQYENYRNYQETIDLINFKYHDLKHQIMGLMAEDDPERRMQQLETMRKELEEYRPERQTGNNVLDTIIASKSLRCKKNSIELTCVADGRLLSQIPVADICSIFGNALDNAIEYESMIPNEDRRMIYLGVMQKKGFIYIEVRNYCPENIKIKNGFPVTTKKDKRMHGYGVKSIAHVVKKNKGNIHFENKDDEFGMKILIPLNA
ncbi:MAG: ATP-binding protein [Lachnospiraceae bacterium]|nr:ATP-binding protein [Lachnospiraceae bacterium]